ncbi:hypothetical protein CVE32_02975, partial [Pseudomonas syringae pv. actinidiae]|nr:hypothetical protein [Pseudomonas syringae pv. actinidiae]
WTGWPDGVECARKAKEYRRPRDAIAESPQVPRQLGNSTDDHGCSCHRQVPKQTREGLEDAYSRLLFESKRSPKP